MYIHKNPKVIFDKYETNRAEEVCLFVFIFFHLKFLVPNSNQREVTLLLNIPLSLFTPHYNQ